MDILDIMMAKKFGGGGGGEGGTTDHRDLSHRNDSNQHSMAAITGLNDALAGKMSADTPIPSALEDLDDDATHRTVTDSEKTAWNGKQDAIGDLTSIRNGAAAGATAVQPSALNSYATQDYVNQQIASAIGDAIGGEY